MSISILRGRPFNASDGPSTDRVTVVTKSLADRLWPTEAPRRYADEYASSVGEALRDERQQLRVVGVVPDTVYRSTIEHERPPTYYLLLAQGLSRALRCTSAPLAALLQVTWIRIAAWVGGVSYVRGLVSTASYTVDPFMEEILKVLPLLLLLRLSAIRRQTSITDAVLIAAATGSGFGLAEALYRVGAAPSAANAIDNGWILGISLALPIVLPPPVSR